MDVWTTGLRLTTFLVLAVTLVMPRQVNSGGCSKPDLCQGNEICKLPKVVGPCEALIPRWWFNDATGTCEEFNYGGCQGNANNFVSKRDCMDKCPTRPGICALLASGTRRVCLQVMTRFCTEDCTCCVNRNSCNPNPAVYTKDPALCP